MSFGSFFDSNVVLYLLSGDSEKAELSEKLMARGGTISVQVLNEFTSVSFLKFKKTIPEIRAALAGVRALCAVTPIDLETHELGLDIAERYKFSVFDSMLVAAALQADCTTFYSEDLQHGQVIEGLTVRNPFIS
ncbi:MAG TPA: PIN domain-containing protein [Rhizomicrobium sp.]|nr:PIN domain-containing protein [Rhizomicrobium sp.]